ncbi:hypothetical protein HOP57_16235 [Halomonas daqingensis]|nr:hypothetical protein [Halomonas desiderata]
MLITTDVKEAEEAELSVLLVKDNWDDYSYKTTFYAFLYLKGEKVDLGMVKIMTTELDDKSSLSHRGENTSTKIPENIDSLPDGFVSLGQELDYYRKISALGRRNGDKVLHALKDCAVYYRPNESVTEHKAFWDSLMRGSEAKKCFNEGANYYFGTVEKKKLSFDYKCDLFENSGSSINFEFNADSDLPSTTNIVIGKNGSGKTRLLGGSCQGICRL